MKTIFIAILCILSIKLCAQKQFLQEHLTKPVIATFFNISNDNVNLSKGEFDEVNQYYTEASIEGYSSYMGAYIRIESNIEGKIGTIVVKYQNILSVESYNRFLKEALYDIVGVSWNETTAKDINAEYTLRNSSWRNDILTVRGRIAGHTGSDGSISKHYPAEILFLYNSASL